MLGIPTTHRTITCLRAMASHYRRRADDLAEASLREAATRLRDDADVVTNLARSLDQALLMDDDPEADALALFTTDPERFHRIYEAMAKVVDTRDSDLAGPVAPHLGPGDMPATVLQTTP